MKKPIPFGKYYLLDRISVGGMAEVFKAKAFGVEGFERLIAVKRILPSIAEDEEFITMFIDEAKIAVQLTHANIAQIFDLGKVGDSFFIALEYVPGKDLRAIFDRMRKTGQSVPIPMACYLTMKVCEGLDYAHNKKDGAGRDLNLVHRDVSPQNILISYDGEVKLIDFGIAKAAGKAGKTQAGILKGKFGYMSPEQVRGLPLDRRSDLFAMGICLWELVTGERLFVGDSDFSTLEKVRNVEITPPSAYNRKIPEDLEKIILKALNKEVEDRYQSAMDLHDDLQSWMYTSGNFFARKDLAAFMCDMFREDIDREAASSEGQEVARSTVPPPPKVVRPGGVRPAARPGAPPPPPRVTSPPPPPGRPMAMGAGAVRQGVAAPPPGRPSAPSRSVPPPPPPTSAAGQRAGAPLPRPGAPMKRTMLGMPAVQDGGGLPPVAPLPLRTTHSDEVLPPDLASGRVATPAAAAHAPAVQMDWDEEEPPTHVYDKKTAAEMAKAAVAQDPMRRTGSFVKASSSLPSYEEERQSAWQPVEPRPPIRPILIGAGAAAAVVVIGLAVYFLALGGKKQGRVELQVDPATELDVVLDGTTKLPGTASPFVLAELAPGVHSLVIKHPGFKDRILSIPVETGETVAKAVKLEQAGGGFSLDTNPPGASVWVDDRPQDDKTPITVSGLTPGRHMVRVTKGESYASLNVEVEVVEGKIEQLPRKTMELKATEVAFSTEPAGAKATLVCGSERKDLGLTPASVTIETEKDCAIEFEKAGFEKISKPIDIVADKEKMEFEKVALVAAAIAKKSPPGGQRSPGATIGPPSGGGGKPGALSVQTKPWTKVSINGQFIRNTPLVNHPLKPGTYTVTCENPTYSIQKTFRVQIKSGETTTLVKTLI
ncbi:MAG: serine/threonine protein kinase [Deltaproteobacteria bacterium]|nr:serine/threonine protein kinase [Deltaproteobacteria bacterium]